jgi:tetratricopeptide (TPR) repeat protein
MSHQEQPADPTPAVTRRTLLTSGVAAAVPAVLPHPVESPVPSQAGAWDTFLRGMTAYRRYTAETNREARTLFAQALALDPRCARAAAMLAATHRQDATFAWSADRTASEAEAAHWAQAALALARHEPAPQPSLPPVLEQWAFVLFYCQQRHVAALEAVREALQHTPTFANGHALEGHILAYLGEPEAALRKAEDAARLDPTAALFDHYHRGHAWLVLGYQRGVQDAGAARPCYVQAQHHFEAALALNPQYRASRVFLVAVLWELGLEDQARQETTILRAMGRPQVAGDRARFAAYVARSHPYAPALAPLRERLITIWEAAETPAPGRA